MEMLSEHTLDGWLEGYLLTGRHGFFPTYEAFVHVIDSMFNQHAKWLDICKNHVPWRASVASQNILLSSTVWRQDHNGFTHQDPGFIDVVTNKSPSVTRIYLPPDANMPAGGGRPLPALDRLHQRHRRRQAEAPAVHRPWTRRSCTAPRASASGRGRATTRASEPDVVMASCGDIPTQEALAAAAILREHFPDLKMRFVNVVDLYKLQPASEHPHGSTDRDFDSLFTVDKPVIFNFHGYPWLIHRLAYRFTNHDNLHVRGYKEKGNINTPLELAILNQIDRFSLVIDVIDRVPGLQAHGRAPEGADEERDHPQPGLRARARHRPRRDHRLGVAVLMERLRDRTELVTMTTTTTRRAGHAALSRHDAHRAVGRGAAAGRARQPVLPAGALSGGRDARTTGTWRSPTACATGCCERWVEHGADLLRRAT